MRRVDGPRVALLFPDSIRHPEGRVTPPEPLASILTRLQERRLRGSAAAGARPTL